MNGNISLTGPEDDVTRQPMERCDLDMTYGNRPNLNNKVKQQQER